MKWDFNTPVHENLTLKAKWKKKAEGTKTSWNYREVAERRARKKTGEGWGTAEEGTAQTGEESKIMWIICCMLGAAGMMIGVVRRRKKQR